MNQTSKYQNKIPGFIPIPGTTKVKNLQSNVKSLQVKLTKADINKLEEIVNVDNIHGKRYEEGHISWEYDLNPKLTSEQEEQAKAELAKM